MMYSLAHKKGNCLEPEKESGPEGKREVTEEDAG